MVRHPVHELGNVIVAHQSMSLSVSGLTHGGLRPPCLANEIIQYGLRMSADGRLGVAKVVGLVRPHDVHVGIHVCDEDDVTTL